MLFRSLSDVLVKVLISTDGTDANSFEIGQMTTMDTSAAAYDWGIAVFADDNNEFHVQTGQGGIEFLTDAGANWLISTQAWYYKIKVYKRK